MPTKKKKSVKKNTKSSKNPSRQHPKHFAKVYWPYIPLLVFVVYALIFSGIRPTNRTFNGTTSNSDVLAYATEMSLSGLLSNTNARRAENGLPPLVLNSKLNSSAQAKANDMVTRNYWSHNTPEGQEPWIFFDAAGYVYQKAGENLAMGYGSSSATVDGWMNSPSHRANILDTTYTEVGFGFKNAAVMTAVSGGNSTNYYEVTVVAAHYAKPPNSSPQPAQISPEQSTLYASDTNNNSNSEQPAEPEPTPETEEVSEPEPQSISEDRVNQPAGNVEEIQKELETILVVNSENEIPEDLESVYTTRSQSLTGGRTPWIATGITSVAFIIAMIWLVRHAVLVKRFLFAGEHFVAHHPFIDIAVVAVVVLAAYLSQTTGVVL